MPRSKMMLDASMFWRSDMTIEEYKKCCGIFAVLDGDGKCKVFNQIDASAWGSAPEGY
jgi:hypothetical protein